MDTVLIKILVAVVYGVVLGIVTIPISKKLALSRTDDPAKVAPLTKLPMKISAIVLGIGASVLLVLKINEVDLLVRNLALLIPIFAISYIDSLVRKIPNPLLIVMLAIEFVYAVYHCIAAKSAEIVPNLAIGFFVGMIVCYLPSLLKIPMGAGDIKYNAVIGICLYAMGFFQAMILMGIFVAIFYAYLLITKKGNRKTLVPMGPFFSIGAVLTMAIPLTGYFDVSLFMV